MKIYKIFREDSPQFITLHLDIEWGGYGAIMTTLNPVDIDFLSTMNAMTATPLSDYTQIWSFLVSENLQINEPHILNYFKVCASLDCGLSFSASNNGRPCCTSQAF